MAAFMLSSAHTVQSCMAYDTCPYVPDRLPAAGSFGNNIYPGVPELAGVLQTPSVRGALTSVLGEDYCMHAHRALHLYEGMGNEQGFHQGKERHHIRIFYCMVSSCARAGGLVLSAMYSCPHTHRYSRGPWASPVSS